MPRRISPSPSTDTGLTNPCRLATVRTQRPVPKGIKKLLGSTTESGGGVHQYPSSNRGRLVSPPDRPFERWPDSAPLGAPAAPVQAIYAPAYPALHAHATTDTHPGAPPSAQPSQYDSPPRSHGRLQERPYVLPDQSQRATSSESAPVGEKQAISAPSRRYDARARDSRFQPYSRPRPRFLDENERDPSIRRTLAPGGGARHQEPGGDAVQMRTLERHDIDLRGYNGQPFPSPQPERGAAVQEAVHYIRVPTFTKQAAHARSDDLIRADPTRFTSPSRTSQPSEQREHARVEDIRYHDLPCPICAYQPKHVHPDALLRCAHRAHTAPSVTATDAAYGLNEAVNVGPEHTYTEPAPAQTSIQPYAIQWQEACPSPNAERPSSPRPLRWILAQPDEFHATVYWRPSSDIDLEIFSQQEQVYAPDTGIFASDPTGLSYSGAELYSQDARVTHSSASRIHAHDPHDLEGNQDQHVVDVPAGRQREHPSVAQSSLPYDRRGSHGEFPHNAISARGPQPVRDLPLLTALESGPRAHPAPSRSAQTPQYQGGALRAQSMVVHDGPVMARPKASFALGHTLSASPLYQPQGCYSPGGLDSYPAQEAHSSARDSSLRAFPQGPSTRTTIRLTRASDESDQLQC
ncbi:uncharacterized protein TRAVEDRAFT_20476 [Trametes versicolor FP-101664 SS1]|uniref:uncharacterized protein n=1 Tax=Trametes versicolor (strain FP-101664) TaxID=717944 RepID=UPI0004621980|nr:uncharacterized protein TRAVEDRAFT_20476 [Trametes versicolor FP-101664 SS1]EIW58477.1 hypothetical protein TRAVEDRAFT_20476 [Trametes versicolor FP-101664 SS1]